MKWLSILKAMMFKKLYNRIKGLFVKPKPIDTRSKVKYGDKVGNVTISMPYQLIKHTEYKVGESYKVGEMIATLHDSKASMLKAIAKVDARRAAREARLRERAIEIMLMSPEEIMELKLTEWLANRQAIESRIEQIIGKWTGKRYIKPVDKQPKGSKAGRFQDILEDAKVEELLAIGKELDKKE